MRLRGTLSLLIALPCLAVSGPAESASNWPPNHARYRLIASGDHRKDRDPPAETVEIFAGPWEQTGAGEFRWFELTVIKDATDSFRCQLLADAVPMMRGQEPVRRVMRYLLEEGDYPAVEYIDAESGEALLPRYQFLSEFLPRPTPTDSVDGAFLPAGLYLGHAVFLVEEAERPLAEWRPIDGKPVTMTRSLMFGTGRTFKDDGAGRFPSWKSDVYPKGDYRYTPWTEDDYRAMMDAGFNYFSYDRVPWHTHYAEPVFYRRMPVADEYPEEFYRSSYMGPIMYLDEPGVHAPGNLWDVQPTELDAAPVYFRTFVERSINDRKMRVRNQLEQDGVALGIIDLVDRDVASWDTILETIFYQLQTDVSALVFENRSRLNEYNKSLALWFGPGLESDRYEMFYLQNCVMRGAARVFGKAWGQSIYGQMEEESRIPCALQAYDMGARHIWYWTSDHDHHMPFPDQLAITQAVTDRARSHPRPPLDALTRIATVAVAIPNGYQITLDNYLHPAGAMWGQWQFSFDYHNRLGVPYGKILAAAAWEALQCIRNGEEVDIVVDAEGFDPAEYPRVVYVRADGSVENGRRVRSPRRVRFDLAESPAPVRDATWTMTFSRVVPRIDGDLAEWADARWTAIDTITSPTGATRVDPRDLSARLALAVDADWLYIAAEVRDDHHTEGDALQLAFDPFFTRGDRYRTDDLELTIAEKEQGPVARRGSPGFHSFPGDLASARVVILRDDAGVTVYEAAVPLSELQPLDPFVQHRIGFNFAVEDVDHGGAKDFTQWTPGLRGGWRMPVHFGALDWTPGDGNNTSLHAMVEEVRTAAVVGEPLEFRLRTACGGVVDGAVEVALAVDGARREVRHTQAHRFEDVREFAITVPTADLDAGRYNIRFAVSGGGREYTRTIPAYLFDPILAAR